MSELEQALAAILRPIVVAAVRDALAEAGAPAGGVAEYMSPEQAAELCAVTPATVRGWVKAGQLHGYRAGRLLRVSRAELQRYLRRPVAGDEEAAEVEGLARDMLERQRRRPNPVR